jgi:hypothetical protein
MTEAAGRWMIQTAPRSVDWPSVTLSAIHTAHQAKLNDPKELEACGG